MELNFKEGIKREVKIKVSEKETALSLGSGGLEVLSTIILSQYFEKISYELIEEQLPPAYSTVGIKLNFDHTAPTPVGMNAVFKTELLKIEGRKLVFKISAEDEKQSIAEGVHERFIIEKEKFMEKVKNKLL